MASEAPAAAARPLPGNVQLVLFDMAGTTVDDLIEGQPLVVVAFRATFLAHDGCNITFEQANAVRGYEKKEALRRLVCASRGIESAEDSEVDTLFSIFKVELDKLTGSMNTEIKGTTDVIKELRGRGIKVCVGSGFPQAVVDAIAANMGWAVDGVFSSDALGAGRPDPIMVTAAMQHCGVTDARRVVKVGDTAVDIEEGKNAGVWTVSVLTGTQGREKLAALEPDCIIPSVVELPQLFEWPHSTL